MGRYELHTVPADKDSFCTSNQRESGVSQRSEAVSTRLNLTAICSMAKQMAEKTKEFIWGRTTGNLCIRESFPHSMDGYNGMGVTQKMVNMFYMNDGTDNYPEDAKPYKKKTEHMIIQISAPRMRPSPNMY